jgi:hypothetical protein
MTIIYAAVDAAMLELQLHCDVVDDGSIQLQRQ